MTNEVQTEKTKTERKLEKERDESEKSKSSTYEIYAVSFLLGDRQPYRRYFFTAVVVVNDTLLALHCKIFFCIIKKRSYSDAYFRR